MQQPTQQPQPDQVRFMTDAEFQLLKAQVVSEPIRQQQERERQRRLQHGNYAAEQVRLAYYKRKRSLWIYGVLTVLTAAVAAACIVISKNEPNPQRQVFFGMGGMLVGVAALSMAILWTKDAIFK